MDKSKPPIPSNEFRLRSASERISADIDGAFLRSKNPGELPAVAPQGRSGRVVPCRNELPDKPSTAAYYRNEGEVSDGFLIALRAMGVAVIEPLPEPPRHPVRGAEP